MTLGQKLLSIKREVLFLILILCTTVPLFFSVPLPNDPNPETVDMFKQLTSLKEGDTVIVQSDWTESTRGESRGAMDALLRTLMQQKVKFAVFSVADPQAPEVARNVIQTINAERAAKGLPIYKPWVDYVELGFFPNGEALGQVINTNIRSAFGQIRVNDDKGQSRGVFESPVLQNVKSISDVDTYAVVTASKSITIMLERFGSKTKMIGLVTGVMGPETFNYFQSGQLKGMSAGLKGVFDMETLISNHYKEPGYLDKGAKYIFTLHMAVFLLIAAVIVGNIGVFLTRRGNA
jgi:hypothetical protein